MFFMFFIRKSMFLSSMVLTGTVVVASSAPWMWSVQSCTQSDTALATSAGRRVPVRYRYRSLQFKTIMPPRLPVTSTIPRRIDSAVISNAAVYRLSSDISRHCPSLKWLYSCSRTRNNDSIEADYERSICVYRPTVSVSISCATMSRLGLIMIND